MRDVQTYLAVPWTIHRAEYDDDGPYTALTIEELPGFVVAGRSNEELEKEFWLALEGFLRSYLQHGEEPALAPEVRAALDNIPPAYAYPVVVYGQNETVRLHSYSAGPAIPTTLHATLSGAAA